MYTVTLTLSIGKPCNVRYCLHIEVRARHRAGSAAASERPPMFDLLGHLLNHRARQNANETPLLSPSFPPFLLFIPFFSPFLPATYGNQPAFCYLSERPAQQRYRTHSFPTSSSLPPFNLANLDLVVGTSLVFQQPALVPLNYLLFFLRTLVLIFFRPNPDSRSTLSTLTPRSRRPSVPPVASPSPYLSILPLVLSSVSPLPFYGLCLLSQHLAIPYNPTDQRHRQERQRLEVNPDQGLTAWCQWRTPAKCRFWRNNAGPCLNFWSSTT